jgi:lactate 2-monooxygenase
VPRRLRPSRKDKDGKPLYSDPSTTVLGQKLDFPLALAPVGVLKIFNRQGEPAVARAAASVGIPYTLSTATSTSIEDVAEAHGPDATR